MEDWKTVVAVICAFIGLLPLLFVMNDNPVMLLWLLWFVPLAVMVRERSHA